MARLKLGVLISGRGSNLQSLIDACADPAFPAEIVLVISNIPNVQGLDRAEKANIPTKTINHKDYDARKKFDQALTETLQQAGVELVCLAGFMRIVTAQFLAHWPDQVINIHPSLLPAFKGIHVHERVIEAGVKFSGCTVHYVVPEMDAGPIITQACVPVKDEDTPDTLAARVLEQEHVIYPLAVRLIAEKRLQQ
ncbi:MAG: phosphoribosylglycinamide formyltransferase [Rhodospirillales bacterium]